MGVPFIYLSVITCQCILFNSKVYKSLEWAGIKPKDFIITAVLSIIQLG